MADAPFKPTNAGPTQVTAAAAGEPGEQTVKMMFPRPVLLTLQGGRTVRFEAGLQDVPKSIADHQYLALNGATAQDSNPNSSWMKTPERADNPISGHHAAFLSSRGYFGGAATVDQATNFYNGLTPANQKAFLADADKWEVPLDSQYLRQTAITSFEHGARQPASNSELEPLNPQNLPSAAPPGTVVGNPNATGTVVTEEVGKEGFSAPVTSTQQAGQISGQPAAVSTAAPVRPNVATSPQPTRQQPQPAKGNPQPAKGPDKK